MARTNAERLNDLQDSIKRREVRVGTLKGRARKREEAELAAMRDEAQQLQGQIESANRPTFFLVSFDDGSLPQPSGRTPRRR